MFQEQNQFVTHLENTLRERMLRNESYSLRSFSKSLGVSHSYLSLILARKRPPSLRLIKRLGEELGFDPLKDVGGRRDLPLPEFEKIATWVHYGILGLVSFPGFSDSPEWIAKKLMIPLHEASSAFTTLEKYGHLKKVRGRWQQVSRPLAVPLPKTSPAAKNFIREFLKKAELSLDGEPLTARDMTTITFAMHEDEIPAAKEMIKTFRRSLAEKFKATRSGARVYTLAVQLFPISTTMEG